MSAAAPDFRSLVRERLASLELPPERLLEIAEELALQLEEVHAEALEKGRAPEEALETALAQIPSWEALAEDIQRAESPVRSAVPEPVRRAVREPEPRGGASRLLSGWHQDVRLALRATRRQPGFALAVAVTLGLGMGVSTALFSVVNAVLLRPLPLPDRDRLVGVYNLEKAFVTHVPLAYPDYRDLRAGRRAFEDLTAYAPKPLSLELPGGSGEIVVGEYVDANYFELLRVRPVLGRAFRPGEGDDPGSAGVLVLSHAAWTRRFGRDPGVVGTTVRVNGLPFTVIGVAPPSFRGLIRGLVPELWVPTGAFALFGSPESPLAVKRDRLENRGSRWVWVLGRLAEGATLEEARQEVRLAGRRLARAYPATNEGRELDALAASSVRVVPGVDSVLFAVSGGLLAVSGLVVLIACANVAGMMLARGASRRHEIAVRLALGAPRSRVVRLLLTEGLLLAGLGAAVGLGLAAASNKALGALRLPLPVNLDLGLATDIRVLAWAGLLGIVVTLAFALLPALRASRVGASETLKEGGRAGRSGRLGATLVVVQVALSVVLLAGSALLLRSLLGARQVDPGFRIEGVAVLETDPSLRGYSLERCRALYERLQAAAGALPGVTAVAYTSHVPLSFELRSTGVAVAGRESSAERDWPEVDASSVGPGYFELLGIPLVAGRGFEEADRAASPRVVVVNETLARRLFPGGDALGRLLFVSGRSSPPARIVGICRDFKSRTLGESARPFVFEALAQGGEPSWTLLVRAADPAALLPALRRTLRELDEQVPVRGLRALEDITSASLLLPRAGATLFGLFGLLGLALAAVGVYGLVAQIAVQRTPEIGVRMALGATARDVFLLVIGQGLRLGLLGTGIGLLLAAGAAPTLRVFLYGVAPRDPLTFVVVPGALLAVTLAAASLPALRATRLDPQRLLRCE